MDLSTYSRSSKRKLRNRQVSKKTLGKKHGERKPKHRNVEKKLLSFQEENINNVDEGIQFENVVDIRASTPDLNKEQIGDDYFPKITDISDIEPHGDYHSNENGGEQQNYQNNGMDTDDYAAENYRCNQNRDEHRTSCDDVSREQSKYAVRHDNQQIETERSAGISDRDQKEKERKRKEKNRYKDLKKDLTSANGRIDALEREFKDYKSLIKRCIFSPPMPADDDEMENEDYGLLPRLPVKKYARVELMEADAKQNRAYKKQLISKMRTVGGSDIKKNVINIFKMLFSSKLKTKICWKGSTKPGKEKAPFKHFETILDAMRQAVKLRFKLCSASDIEKECKLRFKQAGKDYKRKIENRRQQLLN